MTHPPSYDPWQTAATYPDLLIARLRLPAGRSWWLPADDAIVLDDRLTQAERRSALAHELVHRERGDTACDCAVSHAKQERRVSDIAARRLIPLERLLAALMWGRAVEELAQELWVDVPTLIARVHGLTDEERETLGLVTDDQDGWGAA